MVQAITRKTISFPSELHDEIKNEADKERRDFSWQVVKSLEEIFLSSKCQTVQRKRTK
jgi:hypothetical protein